jgi:2-succinyl-5-enolpyruvyl-6-hydroxy-3-cyclohexene-1-carboxylate synthase
VLTETTSNLHEEGVFYCIDQLIMSMGTEQAEAFVPDLLITAGHNLISRKIKSMLKAKVRLHWHVDPVDRGLDTFQCLTSTLAVSPNHFFHALADYQAPRTATYRADFMELNEINLQHHERFLEQCPYSDLTVFQQILPSLPKNSWLQMGNSSVVRYIQLFEPRADLKYKGNRGVSGIDGCTSTAVGAAYPLNEPVTLITGDLAFFYDVNGLWNDLRPENLKIIVINNSGGGIFRIIDGPSQSGVLEEVFELPHTRNAASVCADFKIPYLSANDGDTLNSALKEFWSTKGMAVLEVFTPREVNDGVLKDYFRFLKQQAAGSDLA